MKPDLFPHNELENLGFERWSETMFYIKHMDMALVKAECGTWLLLERGGTVFNSFLKFDDAKKFITENFQ